MDNRTSLLMAMMMSSSGGGGTEVLGTPTDVTKTSGMNLEGRIAPFVAYKNDKYWWREASATISYSSNTDLSSPSTITLHTNGSTIIFGQNINIGIYWVYSSGAYRQTIIDIYKNDFTYIRTITIDDIEISSGSNACWDYLVKDGYIYVLRTGTIAKIEDSESVTSITKTSINTSGMGFTFGEIIGNKVLVTCNANGGNSGASYYIVDFNLDTMTEGTTYGQVHKTYSSMKATGCVKFKDVYYFAVEGVLYSSTDLLTWTQVSGYTNVYYKLFPLGEVCYTVSKTGIYKTEDFVTSTLYQATTVMTDNDTFRFRTAKIFGDKMIFAYSTTAQYEFVFANVERV